MEATDKLVDEPGTWARGGLLDQWASDKWAGWTPDQIEILKTVDQPDWKHANGRIQWRTFFRVHPDALEKLGGDMMKLYRWATVTRGNLLVRRQVRPGSKLSASERAKQAWADRKARKIPRVEADSNGEPKAESTYICTHCGGVSAQGQLLLKSIEAAQRLTKRLG